MTGVLYGESPKCSGECFRSAFWGFSESATGSAPQSAREIGSVPESAFTCQGMRESTLGSTPWSTPNFPGSLGSTPQDTCWESPKSTLKALAGALSGIPIKHSCKWRAGSQRFTKFHSGTFWNPPPLVFSQKYRRYKWEAYWGTDRRRTAVQIGGVLRRFPFSEA